MHQCRSLRNKFHSDTVNACMRHAYDSSDLTTDDTCASVPHVSIYTIVDTVRFRTECSDKVRLGYFLFVTAALADSSTEFRFRWYTQLNTS